MPQYRTPLRYPGGKQKLTAFVKEILVENQLLGGHYAEPYAGGAGVAMELLVKGDVDHVHLNDSSVQIFSFWHSILNEPEEFCRRISRAAMDIDEWRIQREIVRHPDEYGTLEVGFATFYLNRTNRSGVLSAGVIGGLAQEGEWKMDARFPRLELMKRIEVIAAFRDQISVTNLDAETYFQTQVPLLPQETLVYCDPPYFEKANRLYLNHYQPDDHERIANMIQSFAELNWIVSYDGVPQILDYYRGCRHFLYELQYNASRAYKGNEVFIFSDNVIIPRSSSLPFIASALHREGPGLHRAIQ